MQHATDQSVEELCRVFAEALWQAMYVMLQDNRRANTTTHLTHVCNPAADMAEATCSNTPQVAVFDIFLLKTFCSDVCYCRGPAGPAVSYQLSAEFDSTISLLRLQLHILSAYALLPIHIACCATMRTQA